MQALVRREGMRAPSEASAANPRRPRRGSPPSARRNGPAATAWRGPIPDGGSASSFHGPPPHSPQRGPPPARAAPARRRSPPRASPLRPSPAPLAGRRSDRIAPSVEMGGRDGRGGGPRDQRREHQHPGLADQGGCRCVLAAPSSRKGKMHARRPHTGVHGLADERRARGDGELHPAWGPTSATAARPSRLLRPARGRDRHARCRDHSRTAGNPRYKPARPAWPARPAPPSASAQTSRFPGEAAGLAGPQSFCNKAKSSTRRSNRSRRTRPAARPVRSSH